MRVMQSLEISFAHLNSATHSLHTAQVTTNKLIFFTKRLKYARDDGRTVRQRRVFFKKKPCLVRSLLGQAGNLFQNAFLEARA